MINVNDSVGRGSVIVMGREGETVVDVNDLNEADMYVLLGLVGGNVKGHLGIYSGEEVPMAVSSNVRYDGFAVEPVGEARV